MRVMKSNKQRRQEIKTRRFERASKRLALLRNVSDLINLPVGAVLAEHTALRESNSYDPRPLFYVDKPFVCKDCGIEQIWTAVQQKWWYEVAKGDINSTAVRCRDCRHKERQRKTEARRVHFQGLSLKCSQEQR